MNEVIILKEYVQGYVLALIVEACLIHQRETRHPDPIHVSSHFLRPSIVGPCRIEIATMKGGNTLETLTAKLIQNVCAHHYPKFLHGY